MAKIDLNMWYVARVHLNTATNYRAKLIDYCLGNPGEQYIAIGWSWCHYEREINSFEDYYKSVHEEEMEKQRNKNKKFRMPAAVNLFAEIEENALIWTRDLSGYYWICRAKSTAEPRFDEDLDIGAVIPVEAYRYGLEVPGQIRAAFTRPNGGTVERIKAPIIIEYSKFVFNKRRGEEYFSVNKTQGDNFLHNLPDFELEELVISYLQIAKDYYVLSNSIAKKSTTIKIECELLHRKDPGKKAVVQVKAKKQDGLRSSDYRQFVENGYDVYLFCPDYVDDLKSKKVIYITESELLDFVRKNENLLPDNIMKFKDLFGK